jgi:predicted nuclease of predicted toxin-antitoxin system/uracil-DNA glycosylase
MRFLADESCDFAVVRALRAVGHDVTAAAEFAPRATDEQLLAAAFNERRILLTEDKDFGHLVYARAHPSPGVVLIRFPSQARSSLTSTVLDLVRHRGADLMDCFVVITPERVRIRRRRSEPPGARWNEDPALWRTRSEAFRDLQGRIARCQECMTANPGEVIRPLAVDEIPDPPSVVDLLFVGVAPTADQGESRGGHFYSDTCDHLRCGLFRILSEPEFGLGLVNLSLEEGNRRFHHAGCFFVHAAKVRPVVQQRPDNEVIAFCSRRHLAHEITLLQPRAVCFLGTTSLPKAVRGLFDDRIGVTPKHAHCDGWNGLVALTNQPVRGGEARTRETLRELWGGRQR